MPALDWIGKDAVLDHHRRVPYRVLREEPGAGDPEAGNLIVEGDNLEALKALLPRYAGRVDCIYIDPPYNTGNEGWAYNDNVNSPQIRAWLGKTVGKEADDLSRHDKWLCMMLPRLTLLRELLAETGSLWMTLDDAENHRARTLLDETFGTSNFVANVVWQKRISPDARLHLGAAHDNLLVYAKDSRKASFFKVSRTEDQEAGYSNPDGDPRGPWASRDYTAQGTRPNQLYTIVGPDGTEHRPPEGKCWKNVEPAFEELREDGRIWFGVDGTAFPRRKNFLSESEGVASWTWWTNAEAGHNQEAKQEINSVFGTAEPFDTPKPTRLVQRVLEIATGPDALVLDAFAGSGTTAHAVLKQNALDGGRRQFVLVEMEPEVARPVTAERVRRAIEGYSFTGTHKEELLREKVTLTKLRKAEKLLAKAEALAKKHAKRFETIKPTVKDGYFLVEGRRKEEKAVAGLGSGFRYATLGPPMLGETGGLHPEVTFDDLARLVFLHATGEPLPAEPDEAPRLGVANGVAVYLLTEPSGDGVAAPGAGGTLTRALLRSLPAYDGPRIVYGAATTLSPEALAEARVTFRQVPYDLPAA